jgi:predicted nucleotidyltransferase
MKPSEALRANRDRLRALTTSHGVLHPRIFGSVVHGTDVEGSDLDILVDPSASTTLLCLSALQIEAERLLGVHVDILTPRSLPARFRNSVLAEAIAL